MHGQRFRTVIGFCTACILSLQLVCAADNAGGNTALDSANACYIRGDYERAVTFYEQVLSGGQESVELYFNLSNAYYKSHRLADAILNYERALLLAPGDDDVIFNLNLARSHVADKIDLLPEFFLNEWYRSFRSILSSNGWALLCLGLFVAALALLLLYFFSRSISVRKFAFWLAVIIVLVAIPSYIFSWQQKNIITSHKNAIIYNPSVTVKSSPDGQSTDIFVLHEGTRVEIRETIGEWIEIMMADGNVGWVMAGEVRLI